MSRGWLVDGSVDILTWLSQRLDMDYAWGPAADSVWGNAVFSHYPIVLSENHEMPNNDDLSLDRGFLWVEINVGDEEPLRIIATHFHAGRDEGEHRIPQSEAILKRWDGLSRTVILGDLNGRPGDPRDYACWKKPGFWTPSSTQEPKARGSLPRRTGPTSASTIYGRAQTWSQRDTHPTIVKHLITSQSQQRSTHAKSARYR